MSKKGNIVYVGGVDNAVTEEILHAVFIPFGEIKSVQIPKNFKENKNRGFAFVEYDLEEDALDCLDNMDGAELYGKVLHVTIAKASNYVSSADITLFLLYPCTISTTYVSQCLFVSMAVVFLNLFVSGPTEAGPWSSCVVIRRMDPGGAGQRRSRKCRAR